MTKSAFSRQPSAYGSSFARDGFFFCGLDDCRGAPDAWFAPALSRVTGTPEPSCVSGAAEWRSARPRVCAAKSEEIRVKRVVDAATS